MPRPPRPSRRLWLAAAPGLALVLFVSAIGFGAVTLDPPARSTLDGRRLTTYEPATVDSVRDGSWMKNTEAWLDDHVPARQRWLEAHASFSQRVLRQPVVNHVYVGDPDGFLLDKPVALRLPTTFGDRAEQLGKDVRATGTPILWVYAPRREEVFDDRMPAAWQGGYTKGKPAYLQAISRGGPVLDLSPTLSDPANREANYWRTDHHWTPTGAIAAVDLVSQRLAAMGVQVGTDTRAYHTVKYPDFYGSLAREVTAGATRQPDSFDVLQPPAWRARVCAGSVCNRPTFVKKAARAKDKYANRYVAFMGGDFAYQRSVNKDPAAKGTVLILKDSFGDAFSTYFAERVKTLITVDERHYNRPENIRDLVARVKPDVVIVMHNQVSTLGNLSFDSQVWTDMAAVRARRAAKGAASAVGDG